MEGMVRAFKEAEGRLAAEALHHRLEQVELGEIVARALEEKHRDLHGLEVLAALARGLARRVQRESEKKEARNAFKMRFGLRSRSHPAAKGFAAGKERQTIGEPRCLSDGRSYGGGGD